MEREKCKGKKDITAKEGRDGKMMRSLRVKGKQGEKDRPDTELCCGHVLSLSVCSHQPRFGWEPVV